MKKETISFEEEEKIKSLLLLHKVVKATETSLILENGIELEIVPNAGCLGCGNGWYSITELNVCDNIITNVELVCDDLDNYGDEKSYKIFVFAEDRKIKLVQIDGGDGNGYYGTGYDIIVKIKE